MDRLAPALVESGSIVLVVVTLLTRVASGGGHNSSLTDLNTIIGITQSNEFAQFSKNGKLSLIEFLASFTVGIWSTHVGSNKNREGGKKKIFDE